ncbi:LPS-assembly protein LptD [Roseimaritima sediminicola]|uniref:organic solvent tolerance protein OstA n=1 Tax=Roseimaritima sediminicola TaxID=2662066 RepID=UPI0012983FAA|nr:organic solvent tolerance protein OstA [Roseimaritima sediminicola]
MALLRGAARRFGMGEGPRGVGGGSFAAAVFAAVAGGLFLWVALVVTAAQAVAQDNSSEAAEMRVQAQSVWRWREGADDLYLLQGDCQSRFNQREIFSSQLLLKVRRDGDAILVDVLADGDVQVDGQPGTQWNERLRLDARPRIDARRYRGRPPQRPELLTQLQRRSGTVATVAMAAAAEPAGSGGGAAVVPAQFQSPVAPAQLPPGGAVAPPLGAPEALPPGVPQLAPGTVPPGTVVPDGLPAVQPVPPETPGPREGPLGENNFRFLVGGGAQAVEVLPRNASIPPQISFREHVNPNNLQSESVIVARGGVTVVVRDAQAQLDDQLFDVGAVALSADRIVGWMPSVSGMLSGSAAPGVGDGELYLEGDIVFRQGDRVIYADRMYYNVAQQYGMVLEAEVLTSIPQYEGLVRLKADVLQQVAAGQFVAFDAAVTTSRMGVPRYWLQSDQLQMTTREEMVVDPHTGLATPTRRNLLSSTSNYVYVAGVPVLYWPVFTTDLKHSNFYLTDIDVKTDSIFGEQLLLDFDLFQVLGIAEPPDGVEWTLSTDYLGDRGPALGTQLEYEVLSAFGLPGPVKGFADVWAIDDDGTDFLGVGRRNLPPEEDIRGRALLRHRHYLPNDYEFIAEVGLLSDRNFLEQYLENEWDRDKDHDTSLRLRKYYLNNLFDLNVGVRLNEFYTDTNQLPRFDHYGLGGSVLGDHLTWSMHNQIGYADLEVANAPVNPVEAAKFTTLPGETDAEGVIAATRQELAAPIDARIMKIVPYVSGEAAFFGEDASGQERTRLLGQAGVRSTIPMWKHYPTVQSNLLNIRSLAHKMEWHGDFFYADSDADLDDIPLYDPLDDDAQEQFRRRLIFDTFGGPPLPPQYDPRVYAFRQGMQENVTAPSLPIADDLMQARLGLNQRWQTKRGLAGAERIVDLVRLDMDILLFPKDERDNFGEYLGPARYDFRYHAGDRVTFLSDGYFDFFDEGLRSISAGVMSSRPGLGDVYLGVLSLEGPISANVLRGAIDYRLNEKWIVGAGATVDLGAVGNVGQNLSLIRIGESGLFRIGVNVDSGRDNVGLAFSFEPRFWPKRKLGNLGGQLIPPPGVEGLE